MKGVVLLLERDVLFSALAPLLRDVDIGEMRCFDDEIQWLRADGSLSCQLGELLERDLLEEEYEESAPGRLQWSEWRFFDLDFVDSEGALRIVAALLRRFPRSFVDLHEFGGGFVPADRFLSALDSGENPFTTPDHL